MAGDPKKALDVTTDWSKQLVTLSTAVLALSATFTSVFLKNVSFSGKALLQGCWICMGITILAGILYLGRTAGQYNQTDSPTMLDATGLILALIQFFAFIIGMSFLVAVLVMNIGGVSPSPNGG